jgi:hypothetical protein
MKSEIEQNKQLEEDLQLEAAGFTRADIEEMDRRSNEPSTSWEDFLKEIGYDFRD